MTVDVFLRELLKQTGADAVNVRAVKLPDEPINIIVFWAENAVTYEIDDDDWLTTDLLLSDLVVGVRDEIAKGVGE